MSQELTTQAYVTYQGREVVADLPSVRIINEQYKITSSNLAVKTTSNITISSQDIYLPRGNDEVYLTVKQTVAYSGIKKWRIYRLLKDNILSFMMVERRYHIIRSSIDKYLKSTVRKEYKKNKRKK